MKHYIYNYEDYREFIRSEINFIKNQRKTFSIRAMAKHLSMGAASLIEVLNGKKNISLEKAYSISKKLKFDKDETEYFLLLVMFNVSKEADLREYFLDKIRKIKKSHVKRVKLEKTKSFVLTWKYAVILALAGNQELNLTEHDFRKILNLKNENIKDLIDRLQQNEMVDIDKNGYIKSKEENYIFEDKNKNLLVTQYQIDLLNKVILNLTNESYQTRVLGSEVLTFNSVLLPEVEKIANRFLNEIVALSESSKGKDINSVYAAGFQFVKLGKVSL